MASDLATTTRSEKFCVHICRVCVMGCGNCSGCKRWSTTQPYCMHIYRMLVHAIFVLVRNVKWAACSGHTAVDGEYFYKTWATFLS